MADPLGRLVPDELWVLFRRLVPPTEVIRPQGGGRHRAGDREFLAAVIFVATSGCTWRQLPPVFGPAWQTVYRRFARWSRDPGLGPAPPCDPRLITYRNGVPLSQGISGAKAHDRLRQWLRERGIRHRMAHRGIECSQRLGRHRWVVERTVSWLAGCGRLHRRYEHGAAHFLACAGIAVNLTGCRRLNTLLTA
ncbi:transposase [Streptomyces sp. NPDC091027]|uniref:transposase n=1 Tax=Streptomyces sp. NPDC091027 TaxID=3365971 RepID=UPI00380A48C3